jgi:hypothetical protein
MHKGYRAFSQSPLHQNTRDHIPQPLPVVAGDESSLGCAHPSVDQVMARVSGASVSRHRVFFQESFDRFRADPFCGLWFQVIHPAL